MPTARDPRSDARIAHLDCSTGVSGDKFLGALLGAGADDGSFTPEHLRTILALLAPEAILDARVVGSHGIAAWGVRVEAGGQPPARTWASIRDALDATRSELGDDVVDGSMRVFGALAHAEAEVHGTTPDSVHFHEVGAVDSILDVVGVVAGLKALGVETLVATPLALGGGTVETSHGTLPVPAPATALLVRGLPVEPGPSAGELTTPTGAALIATLATGFGPCPAMTPITVGHGTGTRDIGMPNTCRIVIGTPAEQPESLFDETVEILEANIDHISPEAAASAAEQLLAEGALDVWLSPIVMKKGRSALTISVLVFPGDAERFAQRTVALTGTLGVRRSELARLVTGRSVREIDTPWGSVRVKEGAGRVRAEADDVTRIARDTGRSFGEVARELEEIARRD